MPTDDIEQTGLLKHLCCSGDFSSGLNPCISGLEEREDVSSRGPCRSHHQGCVLPPLGHPRYTQSPIALPSNSLIMPQPSFPITVSRQASVLLPQMHYLLYRSYEEIRPADLSKCLRSTDRRGRHLTGPQQRMKCSMGRAWTYARMSGMNVGEEQKTHHVPNYSLNDSCKLINQLLKWRSYLGQNY